MGITLTAAQCVIFAELYWNPGHLVQAEDRAHRMGQQGCVQVRYLIAPGTVDDAMWPMLGRKLQVVGKALDGHATGTATGLQISDASSFSDYIPTDSHQVATAAAPPFTRTGPPHERQQHHQSTPQASGLPIPNMALHAVHQQPSANGQPTYLETQGAPVSGQQGSPDWQPVPASSGQKLQNSGQFLLSGAQAKQRSRQTTLDGGLKRAASTSFQSPESLERPSKSVRRLSRLADGQILAGSGQKLPSSVISSTGAKSDRARLADKPRSGLSPYGSVAQLLDLTQDQEARAATDVAPLHSGPVTTVSECRQRRQSLLQSDSQVVSLAADHLVDLT